MNPSFDTKSKVIFFTVLFGIMLVILLAFIKFSVKKDFYVFSKVSCDPNTEVCFVSECDPEKDPRCEGEIAYYYKITQKKAFNTPPLECTVGDIDCVEFLCSETNKLLLEIEESCSDQP